MNYAIIDNGIVSNIIVLAPDASDLFPNSVLCDGYAIEIGDSYINGKFYHDGEEVLSNDEILYRSQEYLNILLEGESNEDHD